MIDISNIDLKITAIEPSYVNFLNYLKGAEGITLERNDGESDITAPLGVYRKEHPNALIFEYIDSVAKTVTAAKSSEWSMSTIKTIDSKLDSKICYYLAYLFYKEFFAGANLDLYHPETLITIASLYTNGPSATNRSVQLAINFMVAKSVVKSVKGAPVGVDGAISKTGETSKELINIKNYGLGYDVTDKKATQEHINDLTNLIFDLSVMLFMKTQYVDLDKKDTEKYNKFLKGWDNRVNALMLL